MDQHYRHGILVQSSKVEFAAFKSNLNFMPTRSAMRLLEKELAAYITGKDTIQFPYDKPLPKALIHKIAAFRVKEVRERDVR